MRHLASATLALTLLTACQPTPQSPPPQGLRLANDGLRPLNSDLRIDFGRSQAGVIAAVTKLLATSPSSTQPIANCGTIVQWPPFLSLTFVDGNFRGWTAESERFDTVSDLSNRPDGQLHAGRTCN